ncbi:MAG TPA: hypothetical protein PLH72_16710 [Vicinamibacterales bacterium]|nr:hypothetical protein [Vicinamibacterales bacterium]
MPRTALTKTTAVGGYPTAGVAVTMTAADVANGNSAVATGSELIVAHNTGAGAHAVTITSSLDAQNRLGTITAESIAAGAIRIYGPLPLPGWSQTDGLYYFSADHAEVKFGIIKLS